MGAHQTFAKNMRKFAAILLMINLVTLAWLVIGASMELPPWEKSFQQTRSALESFEHDENPAGKVAMAGILRVHVETTEDWTRTAINEYRRSDSALCALTLCNIVGLTILALKRRSGEAGAPTISLPPRLKSTSSVRSPED